GDVAEFPALLPTVRRFKDLPEMELLRGADHIPDFIRLPLLETVLQRRQVGGRIEVAAIGLAYDCRIVSPAALLVDLERILLRWPTFIRKNASRSVADARDA